MQPRDDKERALAEEMGYDVDRVLLTHDLVSGEDIFFAATGITDGDLLRGVRAAESASDCLAQSAHGRTPAAAPIRASMAARRLS